MMKTTIRIILLAVTLFLLAACQQTAEPEAIMDQESAFINTITAASTFRIDGNTLEIRMADNQMAVVAARIP
jgi:uncharacterized lipoprotein YajG